MRRRARRIQEQAELNITAFLNLMVILVPFLLITAVFSRITILELNIPPASNQPLPPQEQPPVPPLEINVLIGTGKMFVADNRGFKSQAFTKATADDFDYVALAELLQKMKDRVPDHTSINVLLAPDVSYDTLISVMDTARVMETRDEKGVPIQMELFPDISIGDVPEKDLAALE